jgi:RNA polymerase sigma factor (sigma-70 family)
MIKEDDRPVKGAWSMTNAQQSLGRNIQALFDAGAIGELTDQQLLEQFNTHDRERAELAFTLLVERHGAMVFQTCGSILRDRHAAEDAFQATFLVLSRKAGSLWFRDSLGPWLYGVACRVARCARSAAIRRTRHEREAAAQTRQTVDIKPFDDRDDVLYDELNQLPHRYRLAVTVCDLEGLTQEQAARRLGWPAGTVRSRLSRGRARLRDRLTRRGLSPVVIPIGVSLARPAVPASVVAATVEIAVRFGAAGAVTGTTASALALTEGVISIMFMSKLKLVLAVGFASGVLVAGTALVGHRALGHVQEAPEELKPQPPNQGGLPAGQAVPAQDSLQPLSAIAKARLDVARRIRDNTYKLYEAGMVDELAELNAQRRYDEVVDAVAVKSDADRVRFGQVRLDGLKRTEQFVRKQHAQGEKSTNDLLAVELDRLEAEDAFARAKARLGAATDVARARMEVAEKVRDAMSKRFKGSLIGTEDFLVWQKRYCDAAHALIQFTGGDKIRLYEEWVAELKQIERTAEDLYRSGQVQQTDIDIVQYYRLEAEQALAIEKAEVAERSDKPMSKE